ncbi:hypothetical protein OPKNFCMD_5891 [Methylobacterium crusticola]|uniref:DUF1345 domain-containing protein n=1 Tax=Methylobacterium crusticola TaxID=1697972 RepID=A0ABQ4R7I3_9HYPH|nr:DUF1345 domain-containing protein [Methylobacterium crusticola]GJD53120.1 hypothetical protein OPKNFCMD_5891 [Methylobacterium crusticola]
MTDPFRAFWLRPRLLGAIAAAACVALLLPSVAVWTRLLAGWCVGVCAYVGLVVGKAAAQSRDDLRREASRLDDSAPVISLFALLAATASVGAVGMLVFGQQEHDAARLPHVVLAALTIVCAWVFVQVVFTVHYAHLYYGEGEQGTSRGGLDFNGDEAPDFWDFLYFSVTIGATSQTSDTDVTAKPMRRIVTAHTVYTYFFNTSLLALAINMAAGLAQH